MGWYEPPLYGRTLSIAIAFISGCLIAFLLGSYAIVAVLPLVLCRVVLTMCLPLSSKQSDRGKGLAAAAVYHVGWVRFYQREIHQSQFGPR